MKCKACKNTVPDGSLYCMYCGEKLVRTKAQKKEISVPKPRQLKSGEWMGQIMVDGVRETVKGWTLEEYRAKAIALKYGITEADKKPSKLTLRQAIREYIDNNEYTLGPSTIRGYEIIYRNRFQNYMDKPASSINYQSMINEEAKKLAPKSVSNGWALVTASLNAAKIPYPDDINLPAVPESDEPFLDYDEVKIFVDAVRGNIAELAALLALHGLRISEILDLDVSQVYDGCIHLQGATVLDKSNQLVHKDTNKNPTSRRVVPVLMPRVYELMPESGKLVKWKPNTILYNVKKVCSEAGVTVCGTHDLRRSFCSLAYHLGWNSQTTQQVGGWKNLSTVEKVYRKLAAKDKNADIEKMIEFYSNN